nr:asparaginase [Sulfurospirillum tamanensis]
MSNTVARVYRGKWVDLTHQAHVAVVDKNGKLLYSLGDPERFTFVRSSAKPFQALVACESGAVEGYGLNDEALALLCASHNGEALHVKNVVEILEKAGLGEAALQCGTHPSLAPAVAKTQPSVLTNAYSNCSGKHTGMLITTQWLGEDVTTYLEPSHPHQERILEVLSELSDTPKEAIGLATDGCGVPVHSLPLRSFALATAHMADPSALEPKRAAYLRRIAGAMMAHPFMVAGSGRVCTRLMEEAKGEAFVKLGADGYYMAGVPSKGWGITCKVEDGNVAICEGLIIHVLHQLGVLSQEGFDALEGFHSPKRTNHRGEVVGRVAYDVVLREHP